MPKTEKILSVFMVVLLFAILGINTWSILSLSYLKYPWLDKILHFFGGVFVFSFYFWFFEYSRKINKPPWPEFFFLIAGIGFAALVGLLWEFMEFGLDYFFIVKEIIDFPAQMGIVDTMADLFFDLAGALFSGIILLYFPKNRLPG